MAIREEYQQLEAEIKKEEERRRKLDFFSVGVFSEKDKKFRYLNAFLFDEIGHDVFDCVDILVSDLEIVFEYANNRWGNIDINSKEVDIECIKKRYEDGYNKYLKDHFDTNPLAFIIILKKLEIISGKLQLDSESEREIDIIERTERSLKLFKKFLSICENRFDINTIPFNLVKKYLPVSFRKETEIFIQDAKDRLLTLKNSRDLNDDEFKSRFEVLSEKCYYFVTLAVIYSLIFYLLFFDDKPKYVKQVFEVLNRISSIESTTNDNNMGANTLVPNSSHTINEIFNLLIRFPAVVIKNLFNYFRSIGDIDLMQYSSIIEAINTSDLNLFKSSINVDLASKLVMLYPVLEIIGAFSLLINSETVQEEEISIRSIANAVTDITSSDLGFESRSKLYEPLFDSSTNQISPLHLERDINNSPLILGFFSYFYKKHRQLVYPKDRQYFDRIFTQEPYKEYCDKALLELDKLYPNNKSLIELLKLVILIPENNSQNHTDESICDVPTEDVTVSELELVSESKIESEPNECEMKENPFDGLNPDAKKACIGDKKSYVGLFIDYLIDRGYIDCENKDAFVRCLCDDEIPESTLDNLKYNVTNKEGRDYKNIVTIMIGRLTRFRADNQIVVDGRVISKGSIYFNKGQINNGELEEWCLFWPFLKDRIKTGTDSLFQSPIRSNVSVIENALKRVNSFINDYEAAKRQDPSITKLDFIKKRH